MWEWPGHQHLSKASHVQPECRTTAIAPLRVLSTSEPSGGLAKLLLVGPFPVSDPESGVGARSGHFHRYPGFVCLLLRTWAKLELYPWDLVSADPPLPRVFPTPRLYQPGSPLSTGGTLALPSALVCPLLNLGISLLRCRKKLFISTFLNPKAIRMLQKAFYVRGKWTPKWGTKLVEEDILGGVGVWAQVGRFELERSSFW